MKYYISDLHFGHKNVIKYCNRPFKNTDEMREGLIFRWNSKVKENDTVYILGDMFYGAKEDYYKVITSLNGKKVLIKGNHDQWIEENEYLEELFEDICDYKVIEDIGRKVVLFHYPIAEWNHKHYNSYHLYGHIHTNHNEYMDSQKNCFNVSADLFEFIPQSLDELIKTV